MIVSASYRTDIPAFYGAWFLRRLAAGYCRTVNPYGGPSGYVDLSASAVDGFVFWTRHPTPFLPALEAVAERGAPFVVQVTITGLPRRFEAATPPPERAIAALRELAARFGRRAVVWRYDPILLSAETPAEWHLRNFARLAAELEGAADEVVVSFVQPYRKTLRHLSEQGVAWSPPPAADRRTLLATLAVTAQARGMRLSTCAQPDLADTPGVAAAACVDLQRLADVAGHPVKARIKGNRPGCLCAQSRDIGDYECCAMGCVYCYAVRDPARASRRRGAHDPAGEFLFPPIPVIKSGN